MSSWPLHSLRGTRGGGEVANGCRAHVAAAAALHPGRAWCGDVDAEAEKDADLRNRIMDAARIQTGEDERNFFTEDVGTDTVVGGRWVINRIPIPVEKFMKETGRFPSAMEVTMLPANMGGGQVVMCSSDDPAHAPPAGALQAGEPSSDGGKLQRQGGPSRAGAGPSNLG